MTDGFLTTYTGRRFYPLAPESNVYEIADIGHALSLLCRFAGHIPRFYSVAQHSVFVSHLAPPDMALRALLHDASEAYLCDLPTGVKYSPDLRGYRDLERRTMRALLKAFGEAEAEPPEVKWADLIVLRSEALTFGLLQPDWACYDLPNLGKIASCWSPREAEQRFLSRFEELTAASSTEEKAAPSSTG